MKFLPILFSLLFPLHAFAQEVTDFASLMQVFIQIVGGDALRILYAVAVIAFVWGIIQFVLNGTDEKKRGEGKQWMLWSAIAMFLILAVWGVVALLVNTFNVTGNVIPQLPDG